MAQNITTNTNTDISGVTAGREVLVMVTGTWGGTTISVQVKDGNGSYVEYPENGSHTANFAKMYRVPEENGLRLVSSGGSGADLWAQVLEVKGS